MNKICFFLLSVLMVGSAFANDLNQPHIVGMANSDLSRDFAETKASMQEVVDVLASQDYFKARKALEIATIYEQIQQSTSTAKETALKTKTAEHNAKKELEEASTAATPAAMMGGKGTGTIELDVHRENKRKGEQLTINSIKLRYISGNTAGLSIGSSIINLSLGESKDGFKLTKVGSDSVEVQSKSGYRRTISIVPDYYSIPPVKSYKKSDAKSSEGIEAN